MRQSSLPSIGLASSTAHIPTRVPGVDWNECIACCSSLIVFVPLEPTLALLRFRPCEKHLLFQCAVCCLRFRHLVVVQLFRSERVNFCWSIRAELQPIQLQNFDIAPTGPCSREGRPCVCNAITAFGRSKESPFFVLKADNCSCTPLAWNARPEVCRSTVGIQTRSSTPSLN